jgi:arylsulfatase A-like enzyme
VFVLTDDLAWNLVQYMPQVQQLRDRGVTFSRYFVTDSLCCPSRSSIFSGRYPHDTGVFTNKGPDGGFQLFHDRGEESSTFATALQARGYRTAMMGKYLNGYQPQSGWVPPGWSEWDVAGNAYREFDYVLNENGRLVGYRHRPRDYLTDVLAGKGTAFIEQAAAARKPFMLEIATFAPHRPYTPAPRDAADFPGLGAPRTPAFDAANQNPPAWLAGRQPLTPPAIADIDASFRKRAQSIQAVDDLIARLEATLRARGLARNTYIVFSSDNGYHMGEHRLLPGKMTAFDSDIRVPLIVAGPGVPHGKTVSQLAENIDLRPTFSELGRAKVPRWVDGHSLVPLLRRHAPRRWRDAVLIEHHGPVRDTGDPDLPAPGSGNPTTYEAIRVPGGVYVEYRGGQREYYDLARDPYELRNIAGNLGRRRLARLHRTLVRLAGCHNGRTCWAASTR